tara:strand:+ start:307 stop:498 length:192 start_codon:yes stop_codon:yes gene_type:complete
MNNEKKKFYVHIVFMLGFVLYATKIIHQIAFLTIAGLVIGYRLYLHFSESKDIHIAIESNEEE